MHDTQEDPIVITGMARTPMGAFQGVLEPMTSSQLGAQALKAAVKDSKLSGEDCDQVFMGCVLPAGQGQAPARQAMLGAGFPHGVPATTVNKMCGSGMQTVIMAHDVLFAGSARMIVAGGMESMTNTPYLLPDARQGLRMGHKRLIDHMFWDGLTDAYEHELMGVFADRTAKEFKITREEQDAFAVQSVQRAQKAIETGKFKREITPVMVKTRKTETLVETDESPGRAKPNKIPHLKPAFGQEGTVTAANASSISDGAAALVLMRLSQAQKRGLKPLAAIRAHAVHAHEPQYFTTAPVPAVEKVLKKAGWHKDDVDLYEINEAFAVVSLYAIKALGISHDKVNIHGGACALGHPIGASGARIMVTLLAALEHYNLSKGVASLCIGGGEATAIALERLA